MLRTKDEVQVGKVFVNNTEDRPEEGSSKAQGKQAERANYRAVAVRNIASAYANAPESKV